MVRLFLQNACALFHLVELLLEDVRVVLTFIHPFANQICLQDVSVSHPFQYPSLPAPPSFAAIDLNVPTAIGHMVASLMSLIAN